MLLFHSLIVSFLSLLALLGQPSTAQDDGQWGSSPCTYISDDNYASNGGLAFYNGTNMVSFPGFQPPGAGPSRWALSTAVLYDNVTFAATNMSYIRQTFWIESNPVQNLSSPDIGYSGAVIALSAFNLPPITTSSRNNNTCDGIFTPSCVTAIKNAAYGAAINFSGMAVPADSSIGLAQLNSIVYQISLANMAACNSNSWQVSYQKYPLGNPYVPGTPSSSDPNTTCPTNVGSGSNLGAGILQLQLAVNSSGLRNYTVYDAAITESTPILLVVWSNNATADAWADTRLLCLTPEFIASGSRTPPSSDGSRTQVGWTVLLFAVLAVVMTGWM